MSFRDHVIAAGLAGAVMAASLFLPHSPEVATGPTPAPPVVDAARR